MILRRRFSTLTIVLSVKSNIANSVGLRVTIYFV